MSSSPQALAIHQSAILVDGHADTPQRFLDDGWHFTGELGAGMLNAATARAGNLAAGFLAVWVDPAQHAPTQYTQHALELADAVLEQVRLHPEALALCLSAEDILAAREAGKFGVLLSVEGAHAFADSLALLRIFHHLGVRSLTLTWNNSNAFADSCVEPHPEPGLTPLGRELIAECNRLGILIDISHSSDQTFWDTLELSTSPIVATHSCCRALAGHPRNLTDDQLRALAARGGLCMVNFFPGFLSDAWMQAWNDLTPERLRLQEAAAAPFREAGVRVPLSTVMRIDQAIVTRIERVPFETLIAHFEHIVRIAGIDHVGLGSDFDGIMSSPLGLDSAADLPRITEALHGRGYSAEDLHKLLGGNFLRVFRQVQLKCRV
jgi:membrane dipeptidase